MEKVVLVDRNNKKIGVKEKLAAHKDGNLHGAFSILVFNSRNELLLQQRAKEKYHCGGLWSNTCCSHPRPNESLFEATHRKLKQEMGFDCKLKKSFSFIYRAKLNKSLIEHEFDTVLIGKYENNPRPNPTEAMNYKWQSIESIKKDVLKNPKKYTPWFKILLKKL